MSISRRSFLTAGAIAAIAAGVSLEPGLKAWAQEPIGKAGSGLTDPLANYTQATFNQYVNSIFVLYGPATVEVTLTGVRDLLPAKVARVGGRESFALFFTGGSVKIPQGTYAIEHPALGKFWLFVVPGDTDENGAQGYIATVNRLGNAGKPSGIKPVNPKRRVVTPVESNPQIPTSPTEAKPSRKGNGEPGLGENEFGRHIRAPID